MTELTICLQNVCKNLGKFSAEEYPKQTQDGFIQKSCSNTSCKAYRETAMTKKLLLIKNCGFMDFFYIKTATTPRKKTYRTLRGQ